MSEPVTTLISPTKWVTTYMRNSMPHTPDDEELIMWVNLIQKNAFLSVINSIRNMGYED